MEVSGCQMSVNKNGVRVSRTPDNSDSQIRKQNLQTPVTHPPAISTHDTTSPNHPSPAYAKQSWPLCSVHRSNCACFWSWRDFHPAQGGARGESKRGVTDRFLTRGVIPCALYNALISLVDMCLLVDICSCSLCSISFRNQDLSK